MTHNLKELSKRLDEALNSPFRNQIAGSTVTIYCHDEEGGLVDLIRSNASRYMGSVRTESALNSGALDEYLTGEDNEYPESVDCGPLEHVYNTKVTFRSPEQAQQFAASIIKNTSGQLTPGKVYRVPSYGGSLDSTLVILTVPLAEKSSGVDAIVNHLDDRMEDFLLGFDLEGTWVEYEEGSPHVFVLNASADDGRQVSERLETVDFVNFRWKQLSGDLDTCCEAALVSMSDKLRVNSSLNETVKKSARPRKNGLRKKLKETEQVGGYANEEEALEDAWNLARHAIDKQLQKYRNYSDFWDSERTDMVLEVPFGDIKVTPIARSEDVLITVRGKTRRGTIRDAIREIRAAAIRNGEALV